MDRLQNIETFVRVAQTQSFAEAARQLRVSQVGGHHARPAARRPSSARRCSTATRARCGCQRLGQAFLRDCTELVGRTNEIVDQMREVRGRAGRHCCACTR